MKRSISWAFVSVLVTAAILAAPVFADSLAINFESYALGTVDGQDGWSSTGAAGSGCATYDHMIVANMYGYASFGTKSLRMSNAVTSGCFGDQTFSKSLINSAGESSAENGAFAGGARQNYFEAQWDFASTVSGAEQPGLSVVASPDRGDGARMSWVQMADTPAGLQVNFFDYQSGAVETGCGPASLNFISSNVASGLSRLVPHTIKVSMEFLDGPENDIVRVYVDGVLKHTGTSWEDYFRECEGNLSRTVDSILFRTGGAAAPATLGNGFVIDNLSLASNTVIAVGTCVFVIAGTTMTLQADCTTDVTIPVPQGFTLDGNGHTITAVDPAGGHFMGAVIRNAGSVAHVTNLTVTTSGLANVCDGGNDRLRGILFDGAAGSITNNHVLNINQGASGCQEGNGIEARNEPFTTAGPDLTVLISGNTVANYQKTGIIANGSVAATITGNTVTGAGPINYIAQNGIQVGFGGTGDLKSNSVSGNNYTPQDTVACGLLFFDADGVRQSKNTLFNNERDVCNFGRGGGSFNPAP
jgi:hypothetical protein